jgi:hypothetical protein
MSRLAGRIGTTRDCIIAGANMDGDDTPLLVTTKAEEETKERAPHRRYDLMNFIVIC